MIITSASQKGGVTKSTLSLALASVLAQRHRVALVDLDPEAFASTMGLGQTASGQPLDASPVAVPMPAGLGELLLFAGGASLALADQPTFATQIARAAAAAEIVVVDTPPNGSSPAVAAALCAASVVVVPVLPDFAAMAGMERLLATMARLNARAPVCALLSRWEARTRLAQDVHQQLVAHHPGITLSSIVPRDQRAAEAMAAGCPVPIYSKRSAAAAAYRIAAYEIGALAGLTIPQGAL